MKTKYQIAIGFTLCMIVVIAAVNPIYAQKKNNFSVKDLPSEVKTSFEKIYPHAVMNNAGKEVEKGETMYEIESVEGKIRRDILFKKDGTVYEVEETVSAALLPKVVAASVKKNFPKFTIRKAEKSTRSSDTTYEMILEKGSKKFEVVFSTDGKIVEKKQMHAKKEKEKEEENDDEKD
jgi:hypothetical protein